MNEHWWSFCPIIDGHCNKKHQFFQPWLRSVNPELKTSQPLKKELMAYTCLNINIWIKVPLIYDKELLKVIHVIAIVQLALFEYKQSLFCSQFIAHSSSLTMDIYLTLFLISWFVADELWMRWWKHISWLPHDYNPTIQFLILSTYCRLSILIVTNGTDDGILFINP